MTVPAGTRYGAYEIVAPLGAGGMGEVYKARDSRLDRLVALKMLPRDFANDATARERFEREARSASALNHPNILTVFDVGRDSGADYLVTELVEGTTLRERLAAGPLPPREVVRLGAQIADGLAAAHGAGLIHRDLKPENVMVTRDGRVKILDFGLAKPLHDSQLAQETRTGISHAGLLVGTVGYIAPEQVRGEPGDTRSDLFALGVVLYEMTSGRRAFDRPTTVEALNAVLNEDAPELGPHTPEGLRQIIGHCLEKDPARRFQSAADVAFALRALSGGSTASGRPVQPPHGIGGRMRSVAAAGPGWRVWAASVLLVGAAAAAGAWITRTPPTLPPRQFTMVTEDGAPPTAAAISPDGRYVAYATTQRVWLRRLSDATARAVSGSDEPRSVFWSPDSAWLGFQAQGQLWKVPAMGDSPPVAIARVPADFTPLGGATWLPDGRILFATGSSGLYEVASTGGEARLMLDVDAGKDADFHHVSALPDGSVVFVTHPTDASAPYVIEVFGGSTRRTLLTGAGLATPRYASSGHLLYATARGLWAVRFDLSARQIAGEPVLLQADGHSLSVAADGTLVWLPDAFGTQQQLVWLERSGISGEPLSRESAGMRDLRLSPDGRHAVATVMTGGNPELWVFDTTRLDERRLTFDPEPDTRPAWVAGGKGIAYICGNALCAMSLDGAVRPQTLLADNVLQVSATSDGTQLLVARRPEDSLADLFVVDTPRDGAAATPRPLIAGPRTQVLADVSPDGRYVAYQSNEGGRFEIYVARFPSGEGKWDVSRGTGTMPRWSATGDRIFFVDDVSRIVEVEVQLTPSFSAGSRRVVVDARVAGANPARDGFDRSLDGQRFLVARSPIEARRLASIRLVENWLAVYGGAR
jgi:Tol biopolymer transport system component